MPHQPITVLLVDDQQDWLDLWGIWLRAEGLHLITSLNATGLSIQQLLKQ